MDTSRRSAGWFTAELLEPLVELNLHCLDLLRERARATAPELLPGILGELGPAWSALGDGALAGLARFPCALVQSSLIEGADGPAGRVHDRPRPPAFFDREQMAGLVREIVVLGWHLARTQRQAAEVMLGMDARCVDLVAGCALRELPRVAEAGSIDVRLRWADRPAIWRHALGAAEDGDQVALGQARLRALQLLAAEVRPETRP